MSDASAAIKAAREVQADVLSPDLFTKASESFFKARNEYQLKNFSSAQELAEKARMLAEQSEFEALKGGGSRVDISAQAPEPEKQTVSPNEKPEVSGEVPGSAPGNAKPQFPGGGVTPPESYQQTPPRGP